MPHPSDNLSRVPARRLKSRGRTSIGLLASLAIALLGTLGWALGLGRYLGLASPLPPPPPAPAPVTLALPLYLPNALALIARDQDGFARAGLQPTIKEHVSGLRALEAMLRGEADMITTAETPVVVAAFTHPELRILAIVSSTDAEPRVIGRPDLGVAAPKDLRGKRVATQRGSAMHFFLHLFLTKHGMRDSDVAMSFMKAEELAPALAAGKIDAFASLHEPYVSQAQALLAGKAVVFAEPGLYQRMELLVTTKSLLDARPELARRTLSALLEAQALAQSEPARAQAMVAKALGLDAQDVARRWATLDLRVRLEQALLPSLEDQAYWAIESGLAPQGPIPNFLKSLDLAPLATLRPQAVTIIR